MDLYETTDCGFENRCSIVGICTNIVHILAKILVFDLFSRLKDCHGAFVLLQNVNIISFTRLHMGVGV